MDNNDYTDFIKRFRIRFQKVPFGKWGDSRILGFYYCHELPAQMMGKLYASSLDIDRYICIGLWKYVLFIGFISEWTQIDPNSREYRRVLRKRERAVNREWRIK